MHRSLIKSFIVRRSIFFRITLFLIFFTSFSYTQTRSNLDLFYMLADSSISLLISPDTHCLKVNSSGLFSIFDNQIFKSAGTKGLSICKDSANNVISYTVEKVSVTYPLMFRDGFLGKYMTQRTAALEGSYYTQAVGYKKFTLSVTDSIAVDEVKKVESEAFPFTKGELPTEPFFSGIIEPIAAITTTAAIIVLYFTVRSK